MTKTVMVTFAAQGQKPVGVSVPVGTVFLKNMESTVIKDTKKPIVFNLTEKEYQEALKLDYNGDGKFNAKDMNDLFKTVKKPYGHFPGEHSTNEYTITPFTYTRELTPKNKDDAKMLGLLLPGYLDYNSSHAVN